LIFHPGYYKRFLEAGIEDILVEDTARTILAALQKLHEGSDPAGPEQLMKAMPEGPERSYVSRLLISSHFLAHDDPDVTKEMAEEMLVWLVRYRFKKEIQQLSADIRSAQQKQDQELLHDLLRRKAELNRHLASMQSGES
jgi:hypothetical protein